MCRNNGVEYGIAQKLKSFVVYFLPFRICLFHRGVRKDTPRRGHAACRWNHLIIRADIKVVRCSILIRSTLLLNSTTGYDDTVY